MTAFSHSRNCTYERFYDIDTPVKAAVERRFYEAAGKELDPQSDSLIISGPAVERHVNNAAWYVSSGNSKIVLAEIEPAVANHMQFKIDGMVEREKIKEDKVSVYLGSVLGHEQHYPFEDLDLMGTWEGREDDILGPLGIFKIRLAQQAEVVNDTWPARAMICTVSLRAGGGKKTTVKNIRSLLSLVGAKVSTVDGSEDEYYNISTIAVHGDPGSYCYYHRLQFSNMGRLVKTLFYTYREGKRTPMATLLIVYK